MCSNPCESELTCFRPVSNRGTYRLLNFFSAALSTTELWWRMNHRKSFRTLLDILSWQYQKYSTTLILVLCLLCVTPLDCSWYSSFAPSPPFLSSWWQKDWKLFTLTLVFFMFSLGVIASAPDDPSLQNVPTCGYFWGVQSLRNALAYWSVECGQSLQNART